MCQHEPGNSSLKKSCRPGVTSQSLKASLATKNIRSHAGYFCGNAKSRGPFLKELQHPCLLQEKKETIPKICGYQEAVQNSVLLCLEILPTLSDFYVNTFGPSGCANCRQRPFLANQTRIITQKPY